MPGTVVATGWRNAAAVFSGADVQAMMSAVFDAPVLTGQFEQSRRVGSLRAETGDQPHGVRLLACGAELADAIQACQLQNMGETHLRRRDGQDLDAAPFNPAVALLVRHGRMGQGQTQQTNVPKLILDPRFAVH